MRWLLLGSMLRVCAATQEVAAPAVVDTPQEVAAPAVVDTPQVADSPWVAPDGLEVTTAPCPLAKPMRGAPACRFDPVEVRGRALQRAARFNCTLAGTPVFVPSNRTPALSLITSVIEGGTSFGFQLLHDVTGKVQVVPEALSEPALLDEQLIGLTPLRGEMAFWKDGVCEAVSGGPLSRVAPLGDGEVVALQVTVERDTRVLLRSRVGTWSSFGLLPWGAEASLRAEAGRVAVLATRNDPPEWEALLPDHARTVVLRRTESPAFDPPRAAAPMPAVQGSRFSTAVTVHQPEGRRWYVRRPGASRRVELPTPDELAGCPAPRGGEKPSAKSYQSVKAPAVTALGPSQVLVTWLEERGRCEYTFVEKVPVRCAPNQPCHDTPPGHWEVQSEPVESEVVVARVNDTVEELSRVTLKGRPQQYVFGSSIAATGRTVVVQASGYLLEFDLGALEAK